MASFLTYWLTGDRFFLFKKLFSIITHDSLYSIMIKKASKYHKNRQHHNWLVYNKIDKILNVHADSFRGIVYDIGCGDAHYKDFLLNFADEYIGVDWSNSNYGSKADVHADLNKALPISDKVADTIFCISVLEHLYAPQTVLNESFRILRFGGKVFLQVPWQWWIHEAPHDYYRYTPFALKHMFEKAGFKNIAIEPTSGFFTTWLLKFNYFSLRWINRQIRIVRGITKIVFIPIWYFNQLLAPVLDRLDKDWMAEAQGYIVTATKEHSTAEL